MDKLAAIHIQDCLFAYTPESPILHIPSFIVEAGTTVFLRGPSGSGKSTLLQLCTGMLIPHQGQISILGQTISTLSASARDRFRATHIGVVLQQFNLIDYLSVQDNIKLAQHFAKPEALDKHPDYLDELLKALHLSQNILQQKANALSVGQQQRVAIARALAMRPKVMLFDEGTSALDPELCGEVLNVIRELGEQHDLTMLMVTHQMGFAKEFADRICFFDGGRIEEQGDARTFFENPQNPRTQQFLNAVMQAK